MTDFHANPGFNMRGLPSRHVRTVIGALAIVGLSSCDQQMRAPRIGGDSAAGAVPALVLSGESVVRIGGRDRRPEYQLEHVSGALRLADGRIVVGDLGSLQLRYFDANGLHLRTVGGRGGGPGEFARLETLARMGEDTVFAWDLIQRRMSLFSPDGDLHATVAIPGMERLHNNLQRRLSNHRVVGSSVLPLRGSRLVVEPRLSPALGEPGSTQTIQDTVPIFLVERYFAHNVEIGSYPGTEYFFHDGIASAHPLGESRRVAAGNDVIYVGSTLDRAIRIISAVTGETVGTIDLPWAPRMPSSADIEMLRARRSRVMGGPEVQAKMVAYAERIPFPSAMPVFSGLLVAGDGRVWVQAYPAPTDRFQEWHIFEPSGSRVASLTMDPSALLLDAGRDHVVVRVVDGLGLHEVQVYRLQARR